VGVRTVATHTYQALVEHTVFGTQERPEILVVFDMEDGFAPSQRALYEHNLLVDAGECEVCASMPVLRALVRVVAEDDLP